MPGWNKAEQADKEQRYREEEKSAELGDIKSFTDHKTVEYMEKWKVAK